MKRVNAEIRNLEKQRAEDSLGLVRSLRELVESQISITEELGDGLDSMTRNRIVPIIESPAQAGMEVVEELEDDLYGESKLMATRTTSPGSH